jgi:hypothetical protein
LQQANFCAGFEHPNAKISEVRGLLWACSSHSYLVFTSVPVPSGRFPLRRFLCQSGSSGSSPARIPDSMTLQYKRQLVGCDISLTHRDIFCMRVSALSKNLL